MYLLLLPVIALVLLVFKYVKHHMDDNELGSVSAQWLHDYRRETHQKD
jgi:hypothetical protein